LTRVKRIARREMATRTRWNDIVHRVDEGEKKISGVKMREEKKNIRRPLRQSAGRAGEQLYKALLPHWLLD